MKLLLTISAMLPLIFFASCGSTSNTSKALTLQEESPVAIEEYYYQKWVAGARGAGSGINFSLALKSVPTDVALKDIYFMDMKTTLEQGKQSPTVFTGYFKTAMNQPVDIIMSSDPKKEYGNTVPETEKESIPFELQNDEAIISYMKDGKEYFYKLTDVKERPTRSMPM